MLKWQKQKGGVRVEKRIQEFLTDKSVKDAAKILGSEKESRFVRTIEKLSSTAKRIEVPNAPNPLIFKQTDNQSGIVGAASSIMYNDIGILTPQIHLINDKNKALTSTVQQNISSIDFLYTVLAGCDFEYSQIVREFFEKDKWAVFYDSYLANRLLQFMTPECLEQLKNVFLIDELRTDIDRHTKNYFFYKRKGVDKYEGVITFDLEQLSIYFHCGDGKDDFSNFLLIPYESATPQQKYDHICYMKRVQNIRELIQDGVLSQQNLEVLIEALKHDFSADVKKLVRSKKIYGKEKNKIVDPIERLWEYNQNTIGKDLGI